MGTSDEYQANQELISMRKKKKSPQIDVVAKRVMPDYSCAMVNYEHAQ